MYSRDGPVNLFGLLSGRANIRFGYCPGWEMSVGLLSVGNCLSGICPRGSVRRAIVLSGYYPDTGWLYVPLNFKEVIVKNILPKMMVIKN